MGRPRKYPERMSRLVQTRVTDEQYDWLIEQAVDWHDGELSAAVRSAIEGSQVLDKILNSADPVSELRQLLGRREQQEAREVYFDETGRYPAES
jgi:hypothetical protein